jgi:hypothetical protein
VWPGIDVRYLAKGRDIEQEFLVRPGANPDQIRVTYTGIKGLAIAPDGSLLTSTVLGTLRETKPIIYQEIDGRRLPTKGRFALTGKTSYTFRLHSFRRTHTLAIDPTLL